jgi:hypothetical protein
MDFKGGKVIGSGSYGCVISPAILFPKTIQPPRGDTTTVNSKNRNEYVTKISESSDANKEWEIQSKIINLLKMKNINIDNIGVFASSIHCLVKEELVNLVTKYFSKHLRFIDDKTYALTDEEDNETCKINLDNFYCGITIKKFKLTGADFYNLIDQKKPQNEDFDDNLKEMINIFYEKLNHLLHLGIFHNDIKLDNVALIDDSVTNSKFVFIDWGIAIIYNSSEDYKSAIDDCYFWFLKRRKYFNDGKYIKIYENLYFCMYFCRMYNKQFAFFNLYNIARFILFVVCYLLEVRNILSDKILDDFMLEYNNRSETFLNAKYDDLISYGKKKGLF